MTDHGSTPSKSLMREYLILALIIVIGTPIAWWWGDKDGKELAARAYSEQSDAAADETADAGEGGEGAGETPESTPEAIERGAALYQMHCVACHGAEADGQGPAAVAFTPGPRNFTDPSAKWTLGRAPGQIHEAVSKGIAGTGMAGFASAMSADELWDVVHYLSSLPGVANATE